MVLKGTLITLQNDNKANANRIKKLPYSGNEAVLWEFYGSFTEFY